MSMFHSPMDSFVSGDEKAKEANSKEDGQGEPKKKASRTSEVTHSLNVNGDGSAVTFTPEEGLKSHDSYESASAHLSQHMGRGENFGMDSEKRAGSSPSKLTPRGASDDMSGASMM